MDSRFKYYLQDQNEKLKFQPNPLCIDMHDLLLLILFFTQNYDINVHKLIETFKQGKAQKYEFEIAKCR